MLVSASSCKPRDYLVPERYRVELEKFKLSWLPVGCTKANMTDSERTHLVLDWCLGEPGESVAWLRLIHYRGPEDIVSRAITSMIQHRRRQIWACACFFTLPKWPRGSYWFRRANCISRREMPMQRGRPQRDRFRSPFNLAWIMPSTALSPESKLRRNGALPKIWYALWGAIAYPSSCLPIPLYVIRQQNDLRRQSRLTDLV